MMHLLADMLNSLVDMVNLFARSCDLNRVLLQQIVLVELIELAPNDLIGQRWVDQRPASILTNQKSFGELS